MKLLGYVFNYTGIKMDTEMINGIVEAPARRNVTELRGFLGLACYYRRFITNLVESSTVLHAVVSVKKAF